MKKITLFMILLQIFILLGCQRNYYNYSNLKDTIVKIEILHIVNKFSVEENASDYDITLYTVLEETSQIQDLLKDLSKIKFIKPLGSPAALSGDAIKLIFLTGEYEIISQRATRRYTSKGKEIMVIQECNKKQFDFLIKKYIR